MMTPMRNGKEYWNDRYKSQNTGWDLGEISPPLKSYFDQLKDKSQTILIPGSGSGYEAEYLWNKGFQNVYFSDFSEVSIERFKRRVPTFPKDQILEGDFFKISRKFNLIIEQTFFSAIDPSLRKAYVHKMFSLLNPKGKLVGLLFNKTFNSPGPPFGGTEGEYKKLFKDYFTIRKLETAYNSVPGRSNNELFFIFEKKEI